MAHKKCMLRAGPGIVAAGLIIDGATTPLRFALSADAPTFCTASTAGIAEGADEMRIFEHR